MDAERNSPSPSSLVWERTPNPFPEDLGMFCETFPEILGTLGTLCVYTEGVGGGVGEPPPGGLSKGGYWFSLRGNRTPQSGVRARRIGLVPRRSP